MSTLTIVRFSLQLERRGIVQSLICCVILIGGLSRARSGKMIANYCCDPHLIFMTRVATENAEFDFEVNPDEHYS